MIAVVKHFPGEGGATANTDDAAASTPRGAALHSLIYCSSKGPQGWLPPVVVGDAQFLVSPLCSVSSAAIEGLLEQPLGFNGLVIIDSLSITDLLSAGAIMANGLDVPDAAVEAVDAGADMVLFGSASLNTSATAVASRIDNRDPKWDPSRISAG